MTYTSAQKKATYKYREANREMYNAKARAYYHKRSLDEDWREERKIKQRIAGKKWRDKQKLIKEQNSVLPEIQNL